MTRNYYIEIKVKERWKLLFSTKRKLEAVKYIKTHRIGDKKYPMRMVKEVRTVMFDRSKS